MANEIQELKFQVGEAWKGVYSPSTAYGLANVVQDPTGLSIYRSLKSGNVGHPLSNASWWFRIIDLSSIKAESDRIAALNQSIAQDEALRVAAEELRQQHEAERVAAETQRNEAEQQRISAEQARVNAESARATAEQQRITAEEGRVSAESARVTAEQARVLAETLRANAEDQRAANEQNRVAAEQQRIERAEQDHQRAESDHAAYIDSLGAFDISSYHATDGVLAKYADLTAALGTNGANIPDDLRKGGMSVKFIQSSDNNYIQARCMAQNFTTDVTQWAIADEGVYVENPEYVYVKTDAEGKILWAIRTDGSIYYGAGCPQQVIDYIEKKIAELSLDEYENIVAFLSDYLGSDTTLKVMIDGINAQIATKVDKVEGKSLIDAEYASSQSVIDNPEWADVKTDSEDKILEGIKTDGTKVIGGDTEIGGNTTILGDVTILGKVDIQGATYTLQENPEWIKVLTDAQDKIIAGVRKDGSVYIGQLEGLDDKLQEMLTQMQQMFDEAEAQIAKIAVFNSIFSIVDDPEFIQVTTDSKGKILQSRNHEGMNKEYIGIETPSLKVNDVDITDNVDAIDTMSVINDPEGRTEIKTDSEGKILSCRDSEGVMHENVGIVTNKIESESLFIAGKDLTELLRNLAFSNNEYKNDSQLNIARKAKQMANIVWTPKADVLTNEGLHIAGVAVKGIPYSSVKEYKKFVGLDVSLHTFMTAVNDIHSLLYTERIAEYNPIDPSTSRSAYGITYHGVNSISYYGNVCSAFVSTALGYPIQYNSWEFQKDVFEDFYVLSNQDEKDLCVGDILAEPGHCAIVTKVKRDSDGKFISLVLSEQTAPIQETTYSYYEIHFRKLMGKGIWCRIKNTDRLNDYNPNVFILDENENLYNYGVDYVYVDDNLTRTYYQCWSSNRDSFFDPRKWGEVEHWVQKEPGRGYSKNRILQSQTEGLLCRSLIDNNYYPITDTTVWERVKNVYEWNPYPYVYNNDIVTFAGDRATFNNNDLIYINYDKGSYTQMQLFKEQVLVKTYDLPAEGFQINVSEDCRNAGMYKARLINSNSYSRYTYFEVVDTSATANIQDNLVDITFDSVYGTPLEVSVVELSGYPILHFELSEEDIKKGSVRINPLVTSYVQSLKQHYISDVTELFVRVVFSGYYGTAISELLSIGTLSSLSAFSIQASRPKDLGVINESTTIVLENGLNNNTYQFSFEVGGDSIELTVLSTDNNVQWITEIPRVLEESKKYIFTITNGIGNFNIINI